MSIFEEQLSRKPDLYPWATQFVNAIHDGHWTHREFSFTADKAQFINSLTTEEQEIITRTLSAIGQIEIAVKTFWAKLGENLPHPSLSDLGFVMANNEVIHNNAYEHLLTVLQLEGVFEENLKNPVVKGRVAYLKKYLKHFSEDERKQFLYAIILFTLFVENVSLFSQFYIVSNFSRFKNVLKDTAAQVRYTRNEETLHALIGIKLINTIREEHPELFDAELEARVMEEAVEAFQAESKVIDWILGDYQSKNLDADLLKDYVASRLNDSMVQIGFGKIFDVPEREELLWMEEETNGTNITDFFHSKPTEYSKGGDYSVSSVFSIGSSK